MISRRALLRTSVAAAVGAATPLLSGAGPARATFPGPVRGTTYQRNGLLHLHVLGQGLSTVPSEPFAATWSPDGSRFVHADGDKLWSVRTDARPRVEVGSDAKRFLQPAFTEDGRFVIYQSEGQLRIIASEGGSILGDAFLTETHAGTDEYPAVSVTGQVVFDRGVPGAQRDLRQWVSARESRLLIANARQASFSPDGTRLLFVRANADQSDLQIWLAAADGTGQTQLTTTAEHGPINVEPAWSPDGATLMYRANAAVDAPDVVNQLRITGGAASMMTAGSAPSWQPGRRNTVRRVWGADHIATAIAASRYSFAAGAAGAVVLSRSDQYYDALGGSALAIRRNAPLLITEPAGLNPAVLAEIKRVLPTSPSARGRVYVLGGVLALPQHIVTALVAAGYEAVRLDGANEFATAVRIADETAPDPILVTVATAHMYYDALAAGAGVGHLDASTLVFCDGDVLPAETLEYLRRVDPERQILVLVGGWAYRAVEAAVRAGLLPGWPAWEHLLGISLVGVDAEHTAALVAKSFFTSPAVAALATNANWYDALTGGAMIGRAGGPLLISSPDALHPRPAQYLSDLSASVEEGIVLGGPLALPAALIGAVGDNVTDAGNWDQTETTASSPHPATAGRVAAAPAGRYAAFARPTLSRTRLAG